MKKMKFIALAVAGAVALVGAGYAAWGNTITTNTSINTGTWSVVLENDSNSSYFAGDQVNKFSRADYVETAMPNNPQYGNNEGTNYEDAAAATNSGDNYVYTLKPTPVGGLVNGETTCNFAFTNLHPGTEAMTRFEMRNKGTIPAKIDAVRISFWKTVDGVEVQIPDSELNAGTTSEAQVINAMKVDPFFQIHRGTGSIEIPVVNLTDVSLRDLQARLSEKMVGTVLKPTDSVYSDELEASKDTLSPIFTFKIPAIALKADANKINSENLGMNANFKVRLEIDFAQYNDITHSLNTAVTPVSPLQ